MKTEKINITPDKSLFPKLGQTGYTVAEALSELIDNSIDARDKKVNIDITIDKNKGVIIIEDDGSGMDKSIASQSIILGNSSKKEGELGKFGIGLKTSCMSLGKKFTLETTPKGSSEEYVLVFDEDEFMKTGSWHEFEIKIKEGVKEDHSFTRITIEKLRINFYGTFFDVLNRHLSERFSPFINNNEVVIRINKKPVQVEKFEVFPDSKQDFSIELSNKSKISGWTGILKIGSVERSGFNLYRFNRLIRAHEKIGYMYHPSKMAITGEIHMDPIPVTHNKREFITEDKLYIEFFEKFSEYLKPILAEVQKRHQDEKIKDLPREIKETLKDNLLKALNNTDELKELAFPGSELKKRAKDDQGILSEKEERDKLDADIATIEKEPEENKTRTPKKTSENKARFITIAGQRYRFDYEWRALEEAVSKQAYLDKEKNTIMVILNSRYHMLKVIPKADLFYHVIFLTEGIVEVFLKENKLTNDKVVELRDRLTQQLADVMAEDVIDDTSRKDAQIIEAQSYLLKNDSGNDKELNVNEKIVLEKRLEGGLNLQEIASELHLSRQRIDQIFHSALNKISGIYHVKAAPSKDAVVEKTKKIDHSEIESVISSTAKTYNVTEEDIISGGRRADLVLPRHTVMYLLRKELHISFPEIARIMKKRDHTTIMYAYNKMSKIIEETVPN